MRAQAGHGPQKPVSGLRRAVRTRDGREVQVTVSASIITDPEGRVIGGFEAVRDITPVVEAEQKLDLLTQLTRGRSVDGG